MIRKWRRFSEPMIFTRFWLWQGILLRTSLKNSIRKWLLSIILIKINIQKVKMFSKKSRLLIRYFQIRENLVLIKVILILIRFIMDPEELINQDIKMMRMSLFLLKTFSGNFFRDKILTEDNNHRLNQEVFQCRFFCFYFWP